MGALLPLADEFWLACHDRPDGLSQLKDFPLGVGLGTALLAELLTPHVVTVTDRDTMQVRRHQVLLLHLRAGRLFLDPGPHGAVEDTWYELLWFLHDEARHIHPDGSAGVPLADVLRYLAGAGDDRARGLLEGPMRGDDYAPARRVGKRVVAKGRLSRQSPPLAVPQKRRQGLRRIVTHVPADPQTAAMPGVRLGHALRRGERLDTQGRLLGALFRLTGLETVLALDAPERRRLDEELTQLNDVLRELLNHAEALMGSAVMTNRM